MVTSDLSASPVSILRSAPMSWVQIRAVAAVFLLDAVDGFDIISITFAAPGLEREWSVSSLVLGFIISAGFAGMAIGSLALSPLADRVGRRPVILGAVLASAIGMLMSALSPSALVLCPVRFFTGIAIGTMLGPMVIVTAELANERRKNFCMGLMSVGVPIGGMVGGVLAVVLLHSFDWRSIFLAGFAFTSISAICTFLFLPESIPFLMARRPTDFARRIMQQMRHMGHTQINIPPAEDATPKAESTSFRDPAFLKLIAILCCIFLGHIVTFYYMIGWMPKMAVDLGYSPSEAASVSTVFNATSIIGQLMFGLVKGRKNLIGALLTIYIGTAITVTLFGLLPPTLEALRMGAALSGFFAAPGVIGTYALVVASFEVEMRSTGLGLVIGSGRAASALAPIAAGALFAAGSGRGQVSMIFATGAAIAAVGLGIFSKGLASTLDRDGILP